jgi:hypothetical protein
MRRFCVHREAIRFVTDKKRDNAAVIKRESSITTKEPESKPQPQPETTNKVF